MKFFKHFTDAHRGQSLQLLKKRHGYAAKGRYWDLVEICAEKLEKESTEEFTEEHCTFAFAKPYLASSLGFANLKQLLSYLQAIAELGLCSFEDQGEVVLCSMPKLLESLDRDAKRARHERDTAAPKKKNKIKNKEEDKDKESIAPKAPPTDPFFRQKFDNKKLPRVAEIWNEHCGPLTKLVMTTPNWNRACEAITAHYCDDQITTAVRSMAENKFLTGGSKSKWKATFSWLIKENGDNIAKVLNGDYDNEQSVSAMLAGMRDLVEAS